MTLAYVATFGDFPTHSATTLEAAQAAAYERAAQWSGDRFDYRWDEYRPGEVWRLMQRMKGGRGRRFSWTRQAVHAVEQITPVAEGGQR